MWGVVSKSLGSRGYRVLLDELTAVRKEAGFSQRQLAARLKRYQNYVSKVETGERRIDPVECVAWARAAGIDPKRFFDRFLRALKAA
jgi:transcriptional regulator with XRE-family HTH domain